MASDEQAAEDARRKAEEAAKIAAAKEAAERAERLRQEQGRTR